MKGDPTVAEITALNAEDETGEYWDPWQSLGIHCASYSSGVDQNAIDVLRGIRDGLYCSDIAERAAMSAEHVELLQSIFCSVNWCEYGTSPRGCFPIDRDGFPALVEAWEAFFLRHWGEPAQGIVTEGQDAAERLGERSE